MNKISVILNGYKRRLQLDEQLAAINNQTVKPDEILLWYNNPGDDSLINYDIMKKIPTALCNVNFGVWSRFAYALNCSHEYICIFDDDTIPGRKWLENCLNTINNVNGLLGTVGLLYTIPLPNQHDKCSYFEHYIRFGWPHNNKYVQQVDFVGHSWFFKKEWLSYFWFEQPNPIFKTCGEDMHFSYMLQKHLGINTFVPPHPHNDKEMWGSIKGTEYGSKHSLWVEGPENQKQLLHQFFNTQRKNGWKLVMDDNYNRN
jgi:glycosyltransferase involved in cell wall biosynthesis